MKKLVLTTAALALSVDLRMGHKRMGQHHSKLGVGQL